MRLQNKTALITAAIRNPGAKLTRTYFDNLSLRECRQAFVAISLWR